MRLAQATRTLRSFLPEVFHLALEEFDGALRRLEEQGTFRGKVRGPTFQDFPEALYPHQLPQSAVQGPPVVENGAEVFDPPELDVEVGEEGAEQLYEVHVTPQLGPEGGDLAVGDVQVFGI